MAEKLDTRTEEQGLQWWQQDEPPQFLSAAPAGAYDLSVVVPTRNERGNAWPLLESLRNALRGLRVEIVFVDDSDDDTPEVINHAKQMMASPEFQIRLEHRVSGSERAGGLATAVVQGLNVAQAAYVAVIDADLQHPPQQLRVLYDQAAAQHADLAIASRYIKGGSYQGLDGAGRIYISRGMKWTAKLLFPEQLWGLSDPLGGFFLLRRSLLTDVSLRPIGYKILLEILIRCRWQHAIEVPYHFQARVHGQSKANMRQGVLALKHMLRLWREVPAAGRIWKISMLVLVNLLITWVLVQINQFFPRVWSNLNSVVFGVMVCLDFVLFSRFLFPARKVTSNTAPPPSFQTPMKESDTVVLPSTVLHGACGDFSETECPTRPERACLRQISAHRGCGDSDPGAWLDWLCQTGCIADPGCPVYWDSAGVHKIGQPRSSDQYSSGYRRWSRHCRLRKLASCRHELARLVDFCAAPGRRDTRGNSCAWVSIHRVALVTTED